MSNQKRDANNYLNAQIKQGGLVELHTHLMGMGNADFWVSKIMEDFLPSRNKDVFYPMKSLLLASGIAFSSSDENSYSFSIAKAKLEARMFDGLGSARFEKDRDCVEKADLEIFLNENKGSTLISESAKSDIQRMLDENDDNHVFSLKSVQDKFAQSKKEKVKDLLNLSPGVDSKLGIWNSTLVNLLEVEDSISKVHPGPLRALVRNWFQFLDTSGRKPNQADVLETCKFL